jgi:hypothetical protein
MPAIAIGNVRYPSVSTEIIGERTPDGTAVTLVITRDESVGLIEHTLLLDYAAEALCGDVALADYAEQILAPQPLGPATYVPVDLALDHRDGTALVVLFTKEGGRLYEWALN